MSRAMTADHSRYGPVPEQGGDSFTARGRTVAVPDRPPRLPIGRALAAVRLPLTLNWSQPDRLFWLADRADRARVYEIVLREGRGDDVLRYVDGALLVDLWPELILPCHVRAAWSPLIDPHLGERNGA